MVSRNFVVHYGINGGRSEIYDASLNPVHGGFYINFLSPKSYYVFNRSSYTLWVYSKLCSDYFFYNVSLKLLWLCFNSFIECRTNWKYFNFKFNRCVPATSLRVAGASEKKSCVGSRRWRRRCVGHKKLYRNDIGPSGRVQL